MALLSGAPPDWVAIIPPGSADWLVCFCAGGHSLQCHEVLDFVSYHIGSVEVVRLEQKLASLGTELSINQIQGSINVLIFTFRAAVREAIAADTLAAELKSFGASVWTAKSVNVLKHVWSARGDTVCAAVKGLAFDVLNIGKLASFSWKLGLSTESSVAKNLGRAFVAVEFRVVDLADNIHPHCVEMSLTQFKAFSKQMKEMQVVLKEIS